MSAPTRRVASRRLTPVIIATSGDNRVHATYVTSARADELFIAGLLTLIEVNGRQEYILLRAPTAQARRA